MSWEVSVGRRLVSVRVDPGRNSYPRLGGSARLDATRRLPSLFPECCDQRLDLLRERDPNVPCTLRQLVGDFGDCGLVRISGTPSLDLKSSREKTRPVA